jgi:TolB-like protein/tetratricopeptide (TPR) repeat protein
VSAEPKSIERLIESIADGGAIDWTAIEASASDDRERRLIGHLRLVAGVAEVHRTTPEEPAVNATPPIPHDQAIARWGHLLLLEKIGEGTFGEVYRARDPWLDREVALKLFKSTTAATLPSTRVLTEARTLARVRHPHVVTVHGADVHDGRVGIWMEFVRGRTLSAMFAAQGPMSAGEAAVVGLELCRALGAVHAAGLVHGDVKAQNVMRESGGRFVLMDFGAGQFVEGQRSSAPRAAGTPLYLAPEVLQGGRLTTQSDIYALGVLLYLLVTGTYPVKASSAEELVTAHLRGERRHLRDARPDLPDAFVAAVERALEPNLQRRFATVGEMLSALTRVTAGGLSARMTAIRPAIAPTRGGWPRARKLTAVALGLVALAGVALWLFSRQSTSTPAGAPRVSTIAVLPFQNATGNPDEDYLGQAVSLELTARLGQIGAIKVVPWSFMKQFAGRNVLTNQVADRTGADAVIEGAVELGPRTGPDADRPVRLRVQMFQAGTGDLLWTRSFARDMGDFFALQADIARDVAGSINVVLAARERAMVSRARRVAPGAMELYLKARQSLESYEDDFKTAIRLFERTIEIEPRFAEAHAGLASAFALQSAYSGLVSSSEGLRRTLDASARALAVDSDLPEAWSARAFAKLALGWDWSGAASDFQRALELDRESPTVRGDYANYLTIVGRHREAIRESLFAETRASLSPLHSRKVAWAYYMARDYDAAIAQLHKVIALDSEYQPARTLLARAYVLDGRMDEAIREMKAAAPGNEAMLAQVYAATGMRDEALRTLSDVLAPSYRFPRRPYHVALVYAALGDRDRTFEWLERAFAEKDANMAHLAVDPALDSMRGDPRFKRLLARMQLEDVPQVNTEP